MQKLLKNIIDHSIYANHIDYVHHSPYMHHDMDIKYTLTILQIPEDWIAQLDLRYCELLTFKGKKKRPW